MNWEALGAIGEILGAVAVVVTLMYLTVQLRQNTQSLQSSTFQAINDGMSRVNEVLATDPVLGGLVIKAQGGLASFTAEERVRYSFCLMMVMRRLHAVCVQEELGVVSVDFTRAYEWSVVSGMVASPGAQDWWRDARYAFPDAFVARIESVQASADLRPPRHVGLALEASPASGESPARSPQTATREG